MIQRIFVFGFTIFAMFFGSGNLVYPLQVGISGGENWVYSYAGFFISGIILPFLGLFVVKIYNGSYSKFFAQGGSIAKHILPLLILSLLGSFAVVPRCIIVAHGGLNFVYGGISLVQFSLIFCATCFILSIQQRYMLNIIGKWLTPILLGFLVILVISGIYCSSLPITSGLSVSSSFYSGFTQGYNTMDLLASFFFSSMIFSQLKQLNSTDENNIGNNDKQTFFIALNASLVGGILLSIVYFSFVYLGAHFGSHLSAHDNSLIENPQLILPAIATYVIGPIGSLVISIIIILSCLTTAIALNKIYANYLAELFSIKQHIIPILFLTTSLSFIISCLDFRGIANLLVPILAVIYPALIVLTISSIISKSENYLKKILFFLTIIYMFYIS